MKIEERAQDVLNRISSASKKAGRDAGSVRLVCVSKKQSASAMQSLIRYFNDRNFPIVFGENYVQEFVKKKDLLLGSFGSHMIGPLQSNKIKDAVKNFDIIESVHMLDVAEMIDAEAQKNKKIQDIFVQVNISQDPAKSGFSDDELIDYIDVIADLKYVALKGLMTITAQYVDKDDVRPEFVKMRELRDRILAMKIPGVPQKLELSMGMSDDFEIAIEEGADEVRVGTAIFGPRL